MSLGSKNIPLAIFKQFFENDLFNFDLERLDRKVDPIRFENDPT